jgi:hypothetical protein
LLAPSCNPHSYTFSLPRLWLSQLIIYVYLPCFELHLDLSHSSCSSNCFFFISLYMWCVLRVWCSGQVLQFEWCRSLTDAALI